MIIRLADTEVELLPEKAIFIPAFKLLCVADMHLGKDSFYHAQATFLPPYGSMETLQNLRSLIGHIRPEIMIAAGDSFHDRHAAGRLQESAIDQLDALIGAVPQWIWITGNHDAEIPEFIPGNRAADIAIGKIAFRHQASKIAQAEISGHYHPKIKLTRLGHRITAPCFVLSSDRLILPSFGQYTGGLDIESADFLAVIAREERQIFAIHEGMVYRI